VFRALRVLGATVLASLCVLGGPQVTHAAEACTSPGRRWIAVRLQGPGFDPALAHAVLVDVQAELGRRGIGACPIETPSDVAPVARLDIDARDPMRMHLSLDIVDPATGKPSSRDLDLSSMPEDGHSLAVAVAADELLASSWIKLAPLPEPASGSSSKPSSAKPKVGQTATVQNPSAPAPVGTGPYELALSGVVDRYTLGSWNLGLDLALRRWLSPRIGLELAAGGRRLGEVVAPHGHVQGWALPVAVHLCTSVVPFAARVRAGVDAAWVAMPIFFRATPDAGTAGSSQSAWAMLAIASLWADLALGRFRLEASLGVGAPLRGVRADDAEVSVAGASGVALQGQVGVSVGLGKGARAR
jgi:hypothetical protein